MKNQNTKTGHINENRSGHFHSKSKNYYYEIQLILAGKMANDPLFRQQVEECHGYLRRDGSLNVEYVIDQMGNQSQRENFPGEIWDRGIACKDNPEDQIQTSSLGRTRKVTKIPFYQAVQQAIDIHRKNYKRASLTDFEENGDGEGDEFFNSGLVNDIFKSYGSSYKENNHEKEIAFNDLVEKILEECFAEDHWSRYTFNKEGVKVKVEPKSWCKDPSTSYTNLAKVFCLLLRQHDLETSLKESVRNKINEIIGDVEITRNFDCYVFLGYDKIYDIDPNGSNPKRGCAKYTREIKKIAEILEDFLDIRKS